jgi:lipoyl-dependent peroxiredoxin
LSCIATGDAAVNESIAEVLWEGRGRDGKGQITVPSGALKAYPYRFASRFEDDRRGTNPEELLGAAHAACFTMAFSFACDKGGFATSRVHTTARVSLAKNADAFVIDKIALTLQATISGIDAATFQRLAEAAKRDCPLSKALAGVAVISLQATLVNTDSHV